MKKPIALSGAIFLCLLLIISSTSALAFLNNFDTASVLGKGDVRGKLGFSGSSDYFSVFVAGNYGMTSALEVSARGGLLNADLGKEDKTGILLGIGGKLRAFIFENEKYPDLALFGTYDFGFADGKALHSLEGGILASKTFSREGSYVKFTPYGGPSLEVRGGSLSDDTDLGLHLAAGVEVSFESQFSLSLEAKIGGGSSYGVSLNYTF